MRRWNGADVSEGDVVAGEGQQPNQDFRFDRSGRRDAHDGAGAGFRRQVIASRRAALCFFIETVLNKPSLGHKSFAADESLLNK